MYLFEFLYYLGFSAKKHYSLGRQRRLPYRVISIGNLTTGGTGKTPATMALAEEAKKRGFRPVILTRGYRGKAKGPCFVTKGEGPLLALEDAGDEPFLMAERLSGIPIVKGGNRYEAGMFAVKELFGQSPQLPDGLLFLLDDGFQHRGLYRNKDVVLIDAGNPFGGRRLLPFGGLREPITAIARADILVLTKTGDTKQTESSVEIKDLIREIREHNPGAPLFLSSHVFSSCRLLSGEKMPVSLLAGKKVFGFCAIGSPASFQKTVLSAGAELAGLRTFRDHYHYSHKDLQRISAEAGACGAEWIVTTEKDIIKTRNLDLPGNILIIEVKFSIEEGFYREVFSF